MPQMTSKKASGEDKEEQRKIDLSEIIGLPDFDVSFHYGVSKMGVGCCCRY